MMNIAYIVNKFPEISETFILNQITGLIDQGHRVDIFALKKPVLLQKIHADVMKYRLLERTVYLPSVPGSRQERLKRAGIIFLRYFLKHPVLVSRCLNFRQYDFYESLYRLIKAEPFLNDRYDIVHCHFGTVGKETIYLKDILKDTQFITTFHGYDMSSIILANGENIYQELFAKGDLFLPISGYWKDKLIKLGCPQKKIIVHRMGIDVNKFNHKRMKDFSNDCIKLLTIGRLVEKKGHAWVIKAIKKLKEKYPNIEYVVAGDGPLQKELQDLVSQLELTDIVKFLGSVEQDEALTLYQKTDIFVLSSVTAQNGDQEGIPVVLMEAMAVGLPVISTYHTGIPELVQDGQSGFLVPERNVDALVERLEYLIEHLEIWPQLGQRGRAIVEEKFNIERLNENLNNLFKNGSI